MEQKRVFLKEKREILLQDEDDISISILQNGEVQGGFLFDEPLGGYGGGAIMLSPTEQYLLFSYYSGQSEEAFILFEIESSALKVVYETDYLYGEEANYRFSEDESVLFQTMRTGCWCEDEMDEAGFYEFGAINCLKIQEKQFQQHCVHIFPGEDWEEDVTDVGEFEVTEVWEHQLSITTPWGKEIVDLPLKDVIVFKPESL